MAAGILKKNHPDMQEDLQARGPAGTLPSYHPHYSHPDMQEDLQARYLVITPTIATPTCRRTCRHVAAPHPNPQPHPTPYPHRNP
eukprot:scaffold34728_cov25-Phaeocystis_antarctica.AAC.1